MTDEELEKIMARINDISLILPIDEKNHRYGIMVPIRNLKQILYEERNEENCPVFKLKEEKAKEYVNGIPFSNANFQIFHKDQIKQVYLDGFAEGIKDGYKNGVDNTRKENRRLEEENATLRSRIKDLHRPPLYDGYSLQKENEKLKTQIEDMKNVGNCEHALNCARWVQQHITSHEVTCCKGCSEWELSK